MVETVSIEVTVSKNQEIITVTKNGGANKNGEMLSVVKNRKPDEAVENITVKSNVASNELESSSDDALAPPHQNEVSKALLAIDNSISEESEQSEDEEDHQIDEVDNDNSSDSITVTATLELPPPTESDAATLECSKISIPAGDEVISHLKSDMESEYISSCSKCKCERLGDKPEICANNDGDEDETEQFRCPSSQCVPSEVDPSEVEPSEVDQADVKTKTCECDADNKLNEVNYALDDAFWMQFGGNKCNRGMRECSNCKQRFESHDEVSTILTDLTNSLMKNPGDITGIAKRHGFRKRMASFFRRFRHALASKHSKGKRHIYSAATPGKNIQMDRKLSCTNLIWYCTPNQP